MRRFTGYLSVALLSALVTAAAAQEAKKEKRLLEELVDADDTPDDTIKFDIQEAYVSGRIAVGNGGTVKAGKFVTLLGYEVIESPNNLNFSRSCSSGSRSRPVGVLAS